MNEVTTLKKATIGDTATLAEYRIQFALELSGDKPVSEIENLRRELIETFAKLTADGTCYSYFAFINGDIAGTGTVHVRHMPGGFRNPTGRWGYLMNMYTVPRFRKRGVCTALLQALVTDGREQGLTAFDLHATEFGLPVYLKFGFTQHSEPTLRLMENPGCI